MQTDEMQGQRGRNPSYRTIPFETDSLYKKYFVNLDLSKFESGSTKEGVMKDYDESSLTSKYAKMGIKFSAVVYDGILAKGNESVHAGGTSDKEYIKNGLPLDKFSAFAYDFSLEPVVVDLKAGTELNVLLHLWES